MMVRIHPHHYVRWDEVVEARVVLGDLPNAPPTLIVRLRWVDPFSYTFVNRTDATKALEELVATINAEAALARGESPAP